MRNIRVREIEAKTALNKSGLPELDYSLNPYLGCLHGCRYCYAIDMTSHMEARENWGEVVAARTNIAKILSKEVNTKKRGLVGIATITDPYQLVELKYGLTRSSIQILLKHGFRVSIQTKSPLVLRDLDLLAGNPGKVDVGMSLATLDQKVANVIDPFAPAPLSRTRALSRLAEAKIDTWAFLGPIIPGINDSKDGLRRVLEFCSDNGIRVIYDTLTIYAGASKLMQTSEGMDFSAIRSRLGPSFKRRVFDTIKEIASGLDLECNSQEEEFEATARRQYRQLF